MVVLKAILMRIHFIKMADERFMLLESRPKHVNYLTRLKMLGRRSHIGA